jgi:MFS family permease
MMRSRSAFSSSFLGLMASCFSTIAWRALFAIGILPAISVFFVRRFVDEPALFIDAQRRYGSGQETRPSFLKIFAPSLLRTTILASLLTIGTQGGYYAIMIWLPTYLKTIRGLSVLSTGGYLSVVIVASFFGYVISAYLTDILGRRKNFILFSVCSVLTVLAYMFLPISNSVLLFLGAPLGFFSSGIYSGIGAFFNELYPTSVCGSGIGFCFNVGGALGALFPAIGGLATSTLLDGDAPWTQIDSVAQRNFSVVQSTGGMHHLPYHFEVWNNADQARDFAVTAWQAPLKGIETFLSGVQGGQTVYERLGKVERLGLVAGAKADAAELGKAASHTRVKIRRAALTRLPSASAC